MHWTVRNKFSQKCHSPSCAHEFRQTECGLRMHLIPTKAHPDYFCRMSVVPLIVWCCLLPGWRLQHQTKAWHAKCDYPTLIVSTSFVGCPLPEFLNQMPAISSNRFSDTWKPRSGKKNTRKCQNDLHAVEMWVSLWFEHFSRHWTRLTFLSLYQRIPILPFWVLSHCPLQEHVLWRQQKLKRQGDPVARTTWSNFLMRSHYVLRLLKLGFISPQSGA